MNLERPVPTVPDTDAPLAGKADGETLPMPRTQSRDARRLQVIEATIDALAERGFSRTTVTDVAARAGISHGLAH